MCRPASGLVPYTAVIPVRRAETGMTQAAARVERAVEWAADGRGMRFLRTLRDCLLALLFLGLVGGMENGTVALWIGFPVCAAIAGSALYLLQPKTTACARARRKRHPHA